MVAYLAVAKLTADAQLAGADHVFKAYGRYIVAVIAVWFGLSLLSKGLQNKMIKGRLNRYKT